jgi:multicomponent K+:H+ antiporter subunit F
MIAMAAWHETAVVWGTHVGVIVLALGLLLCIARLVRGPQLADRAVALDTIAIHLIGLVVIFSIHLNSLVFFDGVLVLSLLGFAGTVAAAQYIARPYIRRRILRRKGGQQ